MDGLTLASAALLPRLLPAMAMLAGIMAVVCGVVLLLRRLAGAIASPPGPEAVLAVCGAGLVLVAAGDLALRSSSHRSGGAALSRLPALLTRLGLLVAMATVCLPLRMTSAIDAFTSMATLFVSFVAVVRGPVAGLLGGGLLGGGLVRSRRAAPAGASVAVISPRGPAAAPAAGGGLSGSLPSPDAAAVAPDGCLLQRFERLVLPDGAECVRGRLRVEVPKGARAGYGHVGFCPPLAVQPTVDVVTDYDGVEAVVSAAEVLPWGVRVECRLDEPAEETIEIPVDVVATTPV